MPNKDGTGPRGAGPKTGRGLGACSGVEEQNQGQGLGRRCGRGQGNGRCGQPKGLGRQSWSRAGFAQNEE
jgi:hypothetical protein